MFTKLRIGNFRQYVNTSYIFNHFTPAELFISTDNYLQPESGRYIPSFYKIYCRSFQHAYFNKQHKLPWLSRSICFTQRQPISHLHRLQNHLNLLNIFLTSFNYDPWDFSLLSFIMHLRESSSTYFFFYLLSTWAYYQ